MAKSMNGWTIDPPKRKQVTVFGKTATVRSGGGVVKLFRWFATMYHLEVEALITFNGYRSAATNKNSGSIFDNSNHRSATAVDINGGKYPYEATFRPQSAWRNTMPLAKQQAVRSILRQVPELAWGTDFNSPYRDPMHYEIRKSVTAKQIKARLKKLGVRKYTVVKSTAGSKGVWLYSAMKTNKKLRTRKKKVGSRISIICIIGKWGVTPKFDFVKMSKLA